MQAKHGFSDKVRRERVTQEGNASEDCGYHARGGTHRHKEDRDEVQGLGGVGQRGSASSLTGRGGGV